MENHIKKNGILTSYQKTFSTIIGIGLNLILIIE